MHTFIYPPKIDSETTVVETLGAVTNVADADYGDDGNFVYKVLGVGEGDTYFTMTQTGQLRLRKQMTLARDKEFEFTIGGTLNVIKHCSGKISLSLCPVVPFWNHDRRKMVWQLQNILV